MTPTFSPTNQDAERRRRLLFANVRYLVGQSRREVVRRLWDLRQWRLLVASCGACPGVDAARVEGVLLGYLRTALREWRRLREELSNLAPATPAAPPSRVLASGPSVPVADPGPGSTAPGTSSRGSSPSGPALPRPSPSALKGRQVC